MSARTQAPLLSTKLHAPDPRDRIGLTQREIGAELYLSLNTSKSRTRSIFRKLGASNRAGRRACPR